jgi:hypothetical protein
MPIRRLKVAMVGGGIGGLSAANAMLRRVSTSPFGSKLTRSARSARVFPSFRTADVSLNEWDWVRRWRRSEVGAKVGEGSAYYRMDGAFVTRGVTADSSGWNGIYGMHRADLLRVLARALPSAAIRSGQRCIGFEQSAHSAQLKFATGETDTVDVAIGADGIQSSLQKHVIEPCTPEYSGSRAYRGLIPREKVPEWPKEAHQIWMGDGKHFMVYPVRSGRFFNYVGFVPTKSETIESWSAIGDRDELAASFDGWDPRVGFLEKSRDLLLVGVVRSQALGFLDDGAPCAPGRCCPCDASASRAGRQSGNRRRRRSRSLSRGARPGRDSRCLAAIRSFPPRTDRRDSGRSAEARSAIGFKVRKPSGSRSRNHEIGRVPQMALRL